MGSVLTALIQLHACIGSDDDTWPRMVNEVFVHNTTALPLERTIRGPGALHPLVF